MKSWKTPTPEQITKAVALLSGHMGQYRYFFDRLENPLWITPLKARGFFRSPPLPLRDEPKGTIGFPPWPESSYLARMAPLTPEVVLEVILGIPDTENVRVHEDLIDAALGMPAALAGRLVDRAKKWVLCPYQLRLPEKLGQLVSHLAKNWETKAALELSKALLEVLPGVEEAGSTDIPEEYRLPPEPRARFDEWHYQEILKKDIPALVRTAGLEAFDLLCDLLETAVNCSLRRGEKDKPEDMSFIWRPAVEDHSQNLPSRGLEHILVSAVRDAAEQLVEAEPSQLPELVKHLEERGWHIFHRIVLHLLRKSPDHAQGLVVERLINRDLFNEPWARHEYSLLIGTAFSQLSQRQQQMILGWIDEGPEIRHSKRERLEPSEIERIQKAWQRNRLAWIASTLPEDWKQRYEALVKEVGPAEHPDLVSVTTSWKGPTSPKSTDELKALSVDAVVEFLKTWEPPKEDWSPSREGLARDLSPVVAADPTRFAEKALLFRLEEPTYVKALIQGFESAVKEKHVFDWRPVIELCAWIMQQPREILGRVVSEHHLDADPDWGWTRKTIARLLEEGFAQGPACLPRELREAVWSILEVLSHDPDPMPDRDAGMEPSHTSINTVRGEAMHTVIRYALWLRRGFEELGDSAKLSRGFDEMPEVKEVLEEHLDLAREPSLGIRSVYGQWFPWLLLLDAQWTKTHLEVIFPADPAHRSLRDAAWETYIRFCHPYDNVLEVLRDQYALAVERLRDSIGSSEDKLSDVERALVDHLMTFAWRSKLDQGLLTKFWEHASPDLRRHAIDFVGRSLYHTEGDVPEVIQGRMKAIWAERLKAIRQTAAGGSATKELEGFGWWFASGKLDDDWALAQLMEALKLCGKMEADHFVVERLVKIAPRMPKQAAEALAALVRVDQEGWGIHGYRDEAKAILTTALASLDADTKQAAEDLVHALGARGYLEFRTLLTT